MNTKANYIILFFTMCISMSGLAQVDSLAQVFIAQKNTEELQNEQKDLNFQKFFLRLYNKKRLATLIKQ